MKIFLIILAILVILVVAVLFLKVSVDVRYDKKLKVYLKISFLKFNLTKEKKQKRCKVEKLSSHIKNSSKNAGNDKKRKEGVCQAKDVNVFDSDNTHVAGEQTEKEALPQTDNTEDIQKISDIKEVISDCKDADKSKPSSIGEKVSLVTEIVRVIFNDFGTFATIKIKKLGITAHRTEASQTALEYAFLNVVLNNVLAIARGYRIFKIGKTVPTVICDFTGQDSVPKFFADIRISIYVYQAIACIIKPWKKYSSYTKNSKNGKAEVKNG